MERLSLRLGYRFKDASLMQLALTHRSCGSRNNERLEFLGDSILGFSIGEALFNKFPKAREGQLSRLRANLVSGETLAEIATEFDLGPNLNLGEGEMKSGGFRRASILADAVEALIGAIYLDSDMDTARARVLDWYASRLEAQSLDELGKDAKSRLQEWLQSHKRALPDYRVASVGGVEHAQEFVVECHVDGLKEPTVGKASSRRNAEKMAASRALEKLTGASKR